MTISPAKALTDYMLENPIPSCLAPHNIKKHSDTIEDLLRHSQTILSFLENNKFHKDIYPLKAPAFEHIFTEFNRYYEKPSNSMKNAIDWKFELIKVEQAIHLITNLSTTQNVSAYLALAEEVCHEGRLCELLILLHMKHAPSINTNSESYTKWLYFLVPYVEHLARIQFNCQEIMNMNATSYVTILKDNIEKLRNRLKRRNINITLPEAGFEDLEGVARVIFQLRDAVMDSSSTRDEQFYYDLGYWSFLTQLISSFFEENSNFFNICVGSSLYLDKINIFLRSQLTALNINPSNKPAIKWREVLNSTCNLLNSQDLAMQTNSSAIWKLDYILYVVYTQKLITLEDFVSEGNGPKPLLLNLLTTICMYKDWLESVSSPLFGSFMNHYESLIWIVFSIINQLCEKIEPKGKDYAQLCVIIAKRADKILLAKKFRVFVRESYHLNLAKLLNNSLISSLALKYWNLSKRSLEDILSSTKSINAEVLSSNLLFTYKVLQEVTSAEVSPQKIDKASYDQLFKKFQESNLNDNTKLKHIAIFLVGVLNLNIPALEADRRTHLEILIGFLIDKCQLDFWDHITLHDRLWPLIQSRPECKEVMEERLIYKYLALYKVEVAKARRVVPSFMKSEQLINNPKLKSIMQDRILENIKDDKENLLNAWQGVSYPSDLLKNENLSGEINFQCRRFIFFTLKWIADAMFESCYVADDLPKILKIFQEISSLYFHPSFCLLTDASEKKAMHEMFLAIFQKKVFIKSFGFETLCKSLKNHFIALNAQFSMGSKEKQDLLQIISSFNTEPHPASKTRNQAALFEGISMDSMLLYSSLLKLYDFNSILLKIEPTSEMKGVEATFREDYEQLLGPLCEFLLNLHHFKFLHYSSMQSDVQVTFQVQNFIAKTLNELETTILILYKLKSDELIISIFSSVLLNKCSVDQDEQIYPQALVIIPNTLKDKSQTVQNKIYKDLLYDPRLWSYLIKATRKIVQQKFKYQKNPLKVKMLHSADLNSLQQLTKILLDNFKTSGNVYNVKHVLAIDKLKPSPKEFLDTIVQDASYELMCFPIVELLSLNEEPLNLIFKSLLTAYEYAYCYRKREETYQTAWVKKSLHKIEYDLFRHQKQTGSFNYYYGDDSSLPLLFQENYFAFDLNSPSSSTVNENTIESSINTSGSNPSAIKKDETEEKLKESIAQKKQELFSIERVGNEVETKLGSILGLSVLLHPFSAFQAIVGGKIRLARREALLTLVEYLDKFNTRYISNERDTTTIGPQSLLIKDDHDSASQTLNQKGLLIVNSQLGGFFCEITTFDHYTQLLADLIIQEIDEVSLDRMFIWNLYHTATTQIKWFITNSLKNRNFSEVLPEVRQEMLKIVKNIAYNLSRLLLTKVTCECSRGELTKEQVLEVFKWIKLVFEVHRHLKEGHKYLMLTFDDSFIVTLIELMHAGFLTNQNAALSFMEATETFIQTILSCDKSSPWYFTIANSLTFMFDALLANCLPTETIIESTVKTIIKDSPSSLVNLASKPFVAEQKKANMETLVHVLLKKFGVSSKQGNMAGPDMFSSNNTIISIDATQEPKTPNSTISEILRDLSTTGRKVLNLLMDALIDNHLINMSRISTVTKELRETSSIFHILSMLLDKHRCLILYIAFQKRDYRSLVKKHISKIPFFDPLNIESFKALTFVECLFKLDYFYSNGHDLFVLAQVFRLNTGVTFINPLNSENVLDSCLLVLSQLFRQMTAELKNKGCKKEEKTALSSLSSYSSFCTILNAFTSIWRDDDGTALQRVFEEPSEKDYAELLKQIFLALRCLLQTHWECLKDLGTVQSTLSTWLSRTFQSHLSKRSLDVATLLRVKQKHYQELLEASLSKTESLLKTSEVTSILQSDMCAPAIGVVDQYELSKRELQYLPEKTISAVKEDDYTDGSFQVLLGKSTVLYGQNAFSKILDKHEASLAEIFTYYQNQSKLDKTESKTLEGFRKYQNATRFDCGLNSSYRRCLSKHLKITCDKRLNACEVPHQMSTVLSDSFESIILEQFQQRVPPEGVNSTKTISNITERQNKGVEEKDDTIVADNKKIEQPEKLSISKVITTYFLHPTIREKAEFDSIVNDTLIKLKYLTEDLLLSLALLGSYQAVEASRKRIVNQELNKYSASLPVFQRNIILCLISRFEELASFEYPYDIDSIKAGFNWIESNFSSYIGILNQNRDSAESSSNIPNSTTKFTTDSTFSNEFRFCTDQQTPILNSPPPQTLEPSFNIKDYEFLKTLYFIDDDTTEAILGLFFVKYAPNMSSYTNTMDLLKELCNSPAFEVKLIDFCLFYLYCGDKHEIGSTNKYDFPHSYVLNPQADGSTAIINIIVRSNILDFLKIYLSDKPYIVCQPRFILEKFGLKSLQKLKIEDKYLSQTPCMVSVSDLLIGLLNSEKIQTNSKLTDELKAIILSIMSNAGQFDITKVQEGEEMMEKPNVLSLQSCLKVTNLFTIEQMSKQNLDILLYDFSFVTKHIDEKIALIQPSLREVNLNIKSIMKAHSENVSLADLTHVFDIQAVFNTLEELLFLVTSLISTWFLEKTSIITTGNIYVSDTQIRKDENYTRALKILGKQILHDKAVEDFIVDLHELATFVLHENLFRAQQTYTLIYCIINICLHYYTLLCIEGEFSNLQVKADDSVKDDELPTLSKIISKEHSKEVIIIPDLLYTFSDIKAFRQYDFDVLFADICRKHQDIISRIASDSKRITGIQKELLLICRRQPWILEFSVKKLTLKTKIARDLVSEGVGTDKRTIQIDRKDLVRTTLIEFSNRPLKALKQKTKVSFQGESGVDAGGLTREWLTIVTKELFNPNYGLFQLSENQVAVQPSKAARMIPHHLKYLELAGIMLGKAIQEDCTVDVTLTRSFLKHILKKPITLRELEDIDPILSKNLTWMLENNVEGLEQAFTYDTGLFGQTATHELFVDGLDTIVTESNKKDYVKKICEMKMKNEIQEELAAFLRGFYLIIPSGVLSSFSAPELQLLIGGALTIDYEDMKNNAAYSGYQVTDAVIVWLWEVLREFSQKELASFLFFVSGSLKPPYGGFKEKKVAITKLYSGPERLPIGHTCSWTIDIPEYQSKEQLRQKLLWAIFEGQGGFFIA